MCSTPPAMTTSYWPAITPTGAKLAACCPEPHIRSSVVPQTSTGKPAISAALRAMLNPCSPTWSTQGFNISRNAAQIAGFPVDVCGTTLDRMCGSGQQAANFAAMGVMAGQYEVVIAGGVEHMTRVPMGSNAMGPGDGPLSPRLQERYN